MRDCDDRFGRHPAPSDGIGTPPDATVFATSSDNVGELLPPSGSANLPGNSVSGHPGIETQDSHLLDEQNEMARSEHNYPYREAGYDGIIHGSTSGPMSIPVSNPVDASSESPRKRDGEAVVTTHIHPEASCEPSAPGRGGIRFCGPSHGGGLHGIRDVSEPIDPRETRSRLEHNPTYLNCETNTDVHKLPDGEDCTIPKNGSGDHGFKLVPDPVVSAQIKNWYGLEVDSQLVAISNEGGFLFRVGGVMHQIDFTMSSIRVGEGIWLDYDDWRGEGGGKQSREGVEAQDIMEVDLSTLTLDLI